MIPSLKLTTIIMQDCHLMRYNKISSIISTVLIILLQSNLVGTFRSSQSRVAISNLDFCKSYWVVVTAVDCVNHVSSSPELIGLFESLKFKFVMSIDGTESCESWVTQDPLRKISEVERYLSLAMKDSSCATAISCVANSQFICGKDPNVITYE